MRLLLDQRLPVSAASALRPDGWSIEHVAEIGLDRATDCEIVAHAGAAGDVVIVTLDSDCHALLAVRNAAAPSVIRIRQDGLRGPAAAELVAWVVAQARDALTAGAVVTVDAERVGIRPLPIDSENHE